MSLAPPLFSCMLTTRLAALPIILLAPFRVTIVVPRTCGSQHSLVDLNLGFVKKLSVTPPSLHRRHPLGGPAHSTSASACWQGLSRHHSPVQTLADRAPRAARLRLHWSPKVLTPPFTTKPQTTRAARRAPRASEANEGDAGEARGTTQGPPLPPELAQLALSGNPRVTSEGGHGARRHRTPVRGRRERRGKNDKKTTQSDPWKGNTHTCFFLFTICLHEA